MAETFKPLNTKRPDIYLAALPKCGIRLVQAPLPMPKTTGRPICHDAPASTDIYAAAIEALAA